MMKNGLFICWLVLFLAACQQPTVYVYTENLTQLQSEQLNAHLQDQSLPFEFTQLPIPKEFSAATLLTSQDKLLRDEAQSLADIMQMMGYQPELNYVSAANHHYTKGNIGFYLRGEHLAQGFKIPQRMRTTDCHQDKYNGLQVTFNEHTVRFALLNTVSADLSWQRFNEYLVINYRNSSQSYSHSTPLVATPFGEKPSDTFRYNAHVNEPSWLNCSLQIVYMD